MLVFTSLLLTTLLGWECLIPSSPSDPPPCAVTKVPGCLPGYRPRFDASGRLLFYACDVNSLPSPADTPPPAPLKSQTPPSPHPAGALATRPSPPEGRGHVGLVFMPGVAAFPVYRGLDQTKVEGQLALEFRGTEGGGRVRITGEYTAFGKIGELSFKYDFFDRFFFRPFLALGLGVASINPDRALRGEGSASAGVDLYIGRDFFLTGELKGRLFTEGTRGPAHGLAISDRRQTSLLAGLGFYFF